MFIFIFIFLFNLEDVEGIKKEVDKAVFQSSPTASIMEQVTTYLDMATYLLSGIAGISLPSCFVSIKNN